MKQTLSEKTSALESIIQGVLKDNSISCTSEWVQDIADMHTKFGVNDVVDILSKDKLKAFLRFRLDFLQEELDEANDAFNSNDPAKAEDIVDALIDMCVVSIGTLDALRVDIDTAWDRVDEKNMEKEPGIKASRPNPLGLPDLIKPEGWTPPSHADNVGLLVKIFDGEM